MPVIEIGKSNWVPDDTMNEFWLPVNDQPLGLERIYGVNSKSRLPWLLKFICV